MLDAAKHCCEQWGVAKVTIDDIAAASGASRATIYRLFPGGKDVLFESLRVRELTEFFDVLTAAVDDHHPGGDPADDLAEFDSLIVRLVTTATAELRADEHLAIMLATAPGETLGNLTVDGLPRIIEAASDYLNPLVKPYIEPADPALLIDLLVRLTISYFLAPSHLVDLGDPASARAVILPAVHAFLDRTATR
ncbi:MAG: TetR family transcriptional regulator [Ilumatobacteraceae bacterium]